MTKTFNALGSNLLDVANIVWYNSETDDTPLKTPKDFCDLINNEPNSAPPNQPQHKLQKTSYKDINGDKFSKDGNDDNFKDSAGTSSDSDGDNTLIDNEELFQSLPSKTVPLTMSKKHKRRSSQHTGKATAVQHDSSTATLQASQMLLDGQGNNIMPA
ncbi:hypothetical protein H0H87_011328, partial [Tephrocybe sp. NHM501043]